MKKENLKKAMERVFDACSNNERVTGVGLKKEFGVSQFLIPCMMNAGYISKTNGYRYKWKVQPYILPVMVRRMETDISACNMEQVNKSRLKKDLEHKIVLESTVKPKEYTIATRPFITEMISADPIKIPEIVIDDSPKTRTESSTKEESVNTATTETSTKEFQIERISRLERSMKVVKSCLELQNTLNDGILDALVSKPEERKTSIRLFGIPIFSITKS